MLGNKRLLISAICGAVLMMAFIILLIVDIAVSVNIISSPQGKIYSGEVASSDAKAGDLFLNTSDYSIYKKNEDGTWSVIGNLTRNNDSTVKSINKIASTSDVDTFEMVFADGAKTSFKIYKNEQFMPQIEIIDGYWAINGNKTNIAAVAKNILKIEFKESKENSDVYEITYTDNSKTLFEMPKAIAGETPRIGENGNWFIGDTDTGIKAGAGRGIKSINKKSTEGLVDTYEILFDDDTTYEFNVTNAVQEKDITIGENGNWFIGGVDTNIKATGNGIKEIKIDDDGLLEITFTDDTVEKYDILSKYFGGNFKVRFHKNGYVVDEDPLDVDEFDIKGGLHVTKPTDPIKRGYHLEGWYNIDGDKWLFSIYTVSTDLELYAKYEKNDYVINLDSNGGEVSKNIINVKFNEEFELPEPILDGYEFNGWYYNNELITSGIYDFDEDLNLVASFIEKETDTFKISTPYDFNKVYENLDKNFILQNDIDLENSILKPFGDYDNPFTGTFDGNGYKISNFKIGDVEGNYSAMFINNDGVIKDLKLENVLNENEKEFVSILCGINSNKIKDVEILGDSTLVSKAKNKAMLVAHNKSTETYENILVEGLIGDAETKKDDFVVGGVICYSETNLILENVTSNIEINIRLNIDKDSLSEAYNQNTIVGGIVGKVESDTTLNITKAFYDGSINTQLSVYCDGLYLEADVAGIVGEANDLVAGEVIASGEINLLIDGLRDGLGTLTAIKNTYVINKLAAIVAKGSIININDTKMDTVINLTNNLKNAHKATEEYTSNLSLENNISALGNNFITVTANHIYSNISVLNNTTLDSNKTVDENLNTIYLDNVIAGLFTKSPTVLVSNAIVDFKQFVNNISFVNSTNYTSNNIVRYAFLDVDNQTTHINGVYKVHQNVIDNTVTNKLDNKNDYMTNATIYVALGFDDTIWTIENGELILSI